MSETEKTNIEETKTKQNPMNTIKPLSQNPENSIFWDLFSTKDGLEDLTENLNIALKNPEITPLIPELEGTDMVFDIDHEALVVVNDIVPSDVNVPLRMFLYMAEANENYWTTLIELGDMGFNADGRIKLPMGLRKLFAILPLADQGNHMASLYEKDQHSDLSVKVQIISQAPQDTLLGQYLSFCKASMETMQKHDGLTDEAFRDLMEYCRKNDILVHYLDTHEAKVKEILKANYILKLEQEALDQED